MIRVASMPARARSPTRRCPLELRPYSAELLARRAATPSTAARGRLPVIRPARLAWSSFSFGQASSRVLATAVLASIAAWASAARANGKVSPMTGLIRPAAASAAAASGRNSAGACCGIGAR